MAIYVEKLSLGKKRIGTSNMYMRNLGFRKLLALLAIQALPLTAQITSVDLSVAPFTFNTGTGNAVFTVSVNYTTLPQVALGIELNAPEGWSFVSPTMETAPGAFSAAPELGQPAFYLGTFYPFEWAVSNVSANSYTLTATLEYDTNMLITGSQSFSVDVLYNVNPTEQPDGSDTIQFFYSGPGTIVGAAVPEPSTYALIFGVGSLAACVGLRRIRSRKAVC